MPNLSASLNSKKAGVSSLSKQEIFIMSSKQSDILRTIVIFLISVYMYLFYRLVCGEEVLGHYEGRDALSEENWKHNVESCNLL